MARIRALVAGAPPNTLPRAADGPKPMNQHYRDTFGSTRPESILRQAATERDASGLSNYNFFLARFAPRPAVRARLRC